MERNSLRDDRKNKKAQRNKMNQRLAKKMRQFMKRKIREDLSKRFINLPELRPKPKWIPKFMKSWFSKTPEFIHGDTENPLTFTKIGYKL